MKIQNKTSIYKLLVFALLILNCLILYYFEKNENKKNQYVKILRYTSDSLRRIENNQKYLSDKVLAGIKIQSRSLNDSIELVNNEGSSLFFRQLFHDNETKFCFFYKDIHCQPCIDKEIGKLKELSKKIGKHKVVIIANYKSHTEFARFVEANNIDFNVFNYSKSEFITDFPTYFPFYFLSNTGFKVNMVFIPDKKQDNLTKEYYKIVESSFLNK